MNILSLPWNYQFGFDSHVEFREILGDRDPAPDKREEREVATVNRLCPRRPARCLASPSNVPQQKLISEHLLYFPG
jgi:hypothetical protein